MLDKGWVLLSRADPDYEKGAWNFVNTVVTNFGNPEMILCPCIDCRNVNHQYVGTIVEHLVTRGMDAKYKQRIDWYEHGDVITAENKNKEIINDEAYNLYRAAHFLDEDYMAPNQFVNEDGPQPIGDNGADDFTAKLEAAATPLYPNCSSYNKLSGNVALLRLKTRSRWSDKSFDELLNILGDMLPENNVLEKSLYSLKKFLKTFEIGYEKIHACVNDCCLFRNEYKDLDNCPKCGVSRWKISKRTEETRKGIPIKILRYFPIISRFKRMFRSEQMAKALRWHFMLSTQLLQVVDTESINNCKLLDWTGTEDIVAEGRLISDDPKEFVNHIPLGPNALKVLVGTPNKPDTFLWRPTSTMTCINQAQGETIAWPADRVILQMEQHSERHDNISVPSNNSRTKCILFDWSGKNEIVAEGFRYSSDPNALVNNIPLGPNAMIVGIEISRIPKAFLWRPTSNLTFIEDAVNSTIAWPADKVLLDRSPESQEDNNISSPLSVNTNNLNKKCKLLDVRESGQVVAEGRWSSSDPNELVHFVSLGPNAVRIWVDTVKVPTASLWRPTSEMEFIEDAIGTTVAWPANKVIVI